MTKTELNQLYLTAKLRLLREVETSDEVIELGERIDAMRESILSEVNIETLESSFDSEDIRKTLKTRLGPDSVLKDIQ